MYQFVNTRKRQVVLLAMIFIFMAGCFLLLLPQVFASINSELDNLMTSLLGDAVKGFGPTVSDAFFGDAERNVLSRGSDIITNVMKMMQGFGVGFVFIYTLIEVINTAKQGRYSLDDYLAIFVKFMAGFMIVQLSPTLIKYLEELMAEICKQINTSFQQEIEWTVGADNKLGRGMGFFEKLVTLMVMRILGMVVSWIVTIVVKIVTYALVLELSVRKLFLPIALASVVEGGGRSPGVRYVKKFCAMYIRIAILISSFYLAGILAYASLENAELPTEAGTALQSASSGGDPSVAQTAMIVAGTISGIKDLTSLFAFMFTKYAFDFAAITLSRRAGAIADEVVGV